VQRCQFCDEVLAALATTYILRCCGDEFTPNKTARLHSSKPAKDKGYAFQDLIEAECPHCHLTAMACVGVDEDGDPLSYKAIKRDQHATWRARAEKRTVASAPTPLRAPGTNSPEDLGDSKKKMETVTGCVQDKQSGKYRYKDVIRVQ
jgi:hypothetical protein